MIQDDVILHPGPQAALHISEVVMGVRWPAMQIGLTTGLKEDACYQDARDLVGDDPTDLLHGLLGVGTGYGSVVVTHVAQIMLKTAVDPVQKELHHAAIDRYWRRVAGPEQPFEPFEATGRQRDVMRLDQEIERPHPLNNFIRNAVSVIQQITQPTETQLYAVALTTDDGKFSTLVAKSRLDQGPSLYPCRPGTEKDQFFYITGADGQPIYV